METLLVAGVSVARLSVYRYIITVRAMVPSTGGTVQVTVLRILPVTPVSCLVSLLTTTALGACTTKDATSLHRQGELVHLRTR